MAELRFALLAHTEVPGAKDHLDLLVEVRPGEDPEERACLTLRRDGLGPLAALESEELVDPTQPAVRLVRTRDHRRFYLGHEGPVAGGRGRVERREGGVWLPKSLLDEYLEGVFDNGFRPVYLRLHRLAASAALQAEAAAGEIASMASAAAVPPQVPAAVPVAASDAWILARLDV